MNEESRAAKRRVRDLALPEGAVIALIARNEQTIPPHGNTTIIPGDHVILVLRPGLLPMVSQVFGSRDAIRDALPPLLEFPLRPSVTVGELEEVYGIKMNASPGCTLDEAIKRELGTDKVAVDSIVRFGPIALHVREVTPEGSVERVGMVILTDNDTL